MAQNYDRIAGLKEKNRSEIGARPNWCKKDQTVLIKQKADLAGARRSRPDCFNKRIGPLDPILKKSRPRPKTGTHKGGLRR